MTNERLLWHHRLATVLLVGTLLVYLVLLCGCGSTGPIRDYLLFDGDSWIRCVDDGRGVECNALDVQVPAFEDAVLKIADDGCENWCTCPQKGLTCTTEMRDCDCTFYGGIDYGDDLDSTVPTLTKRTGLSPQTSGQAPDPGAKPGISTE